MFLNDIKAYRSSIKAFSYPELNLMFLLFVLNGTFRYNPLYKSRLFTMLDLITTTEKDTDTCTELYLKTFASDPWYEDNDLYEVQDYVKAFMNKNDRTLYALSLDGKIIALAFTNTVPCPGHPFLRIEDFCMDPDYIRLGLGSKFLALIEQEAKKNNCNCILLATVENSPSQSFYSRNGFAKLDNSIYLYKEI